MSTGHWLDALLGRSRLQIEWNGTPLTKRDTLAFTDDFEVVDSGANGGRTVVGLAGGGELDGDVSGDTDDNFIIRISGDDEDAEVRVFATAFLWDDSVSDGEAELSVSTDELDGGALQMVHNAKRVMLFTSSGPVIGNTTGVNSHVGGERHTVRTISSNITLDTTTKDTIGWISASLERQVTLPAPSVGRVFFFPTVGATSPSIRRGSALINGVASNYTMPLDADGGIGIAISDGTNWVVRSIYTPTAGGAEEAAIVFSAVDTLRENNTDSPADTTFDQTSGTAFFVRSGTSCDITGVRFYWAGTANQVVKTTLYSAAGAVLKTANVTTAGAGVYSSVFASPQTAQPGIQYKVAVWDTTAVGKKYTKISNASLTAGLVPARPFFGGRRIGWISFGQWLAGDNNPTSTASNEWYLVEPVLSE